MDGSGLELLRPHPRVADDASVSYRAKHIRALFAEIERMRALVYHGSEDGMQSFGDAIARAESAEASLEQVTKERDEARRYCSAAYHDYVALFDGVSNAENAHLYPRTIADLRQTSEFMKLASEGKENGSIYEDELTTARCRAEVLQAEVEKLTAALQDIADGRGICRTCGTPATGPGPGYTDCGCSYPTWDHQDPAKIARAALNPKDPA